MQETSAPIESEVSAGRAYASALLGAPLGLLVAFVFFTATGHDDAHMTYWAAHTLAESGEILNYSGERVEQSSSLLHTLVLALAHVVSGLALPALGYYLGIAFAFCAVVRLAALALRRGLHTGIGHYAVAASVPAFGYWTLGGLETSLAAWLLVELAIVYVDGLTGRRSGLGPFAWLATFALLAVRPEMVFVVAAAWVGLGLLVWWSSPAREAEDGDLEAEERDDDDADQPNGRAAALRAWLRLGVVTAVSFAALVVFRQLYFDASFPQPVAAKTGEHDYFADLVSGLHYLADVFSRADHAALAVALGCALVAAWRARAAFAASAAVPLVFASAYLAFVAAVGGDWMEAGRFVAPVVPLLAFSLFELIERLTPVRGGRAFALTALAGLQLLGSFELAAHESTGRTLWKALQVDPIIRAHTRGIDVTWSERARMENCRDALAYGEISHVVGKALEHRDRLTILSGQAGMVMYYLRQEYGDRLEFIDRFGLTSRRLMALAEEEQIPRGPYGLWMTTERYLDLARARAGEGLVPDVIFDIRPRDRQEAVRAGYDLMYEQSGAAASWWEPRSEPTVFTQGMQMTEFIAVSEELASEMALPDRPVKFHWDSAKRAYFEGSGHE